MIVTVFRSRLMPGLKDEYIALVDRMVELARATPGYISHKGFFADDGERCTIVEFESEEGQKAYGALTPLQRMADPSEIAAAAAFLASSDSSFMTGSEVAVDGGLAQL